MNLFRAPKVSSGYTSLDRDAVFLSAIGLATLALFGAALGFAFLAFGLKGIPAVMAVSAALAILMNCGGAEVEQIGQNDV